MSGIREAEYAKLIENTHRQVNIALVNELLVVGRRLNIDVREALRGAATKPYGYTAFSPGPGVGGHCIPVDPLYLVDAARRAQIAPTLIDAAQRINDQMPAYTAERISSALNERQPQVDVPRVLLMGVGYKPLTADIRNSPAAALYSQLRQRGCEVAYHDGLVKEWTPDHAGTVLSSIPLDSSVAAEYDVVVLLQDVRSHVAFAMTLELSNTLVFDTRGSLAQAHWVVQL
jgi:nucleotide sugar dehydrogenase